MVLSVSDPRVKVFDTPNGGVSRARNFGVSKAVGTYIAFLDADDIWKPWHISELFSLIQSFPECTIYSTGHEICRDGRFFSQRTALDKDFFGVVPNFFRAFQAGLSLINSSTACIKKDVFNDIGGFPEGVTKGEDVYVWIKAALQGEAAYSARCSAVYNQEAENRSGYIATVEYPYYLKWLDDLVASDKIPAHIEKDDLLNFARRCVFFNAAGAALIGAREAVNGMRGLSFSRSLDMRIYFFILSITPGCILRLAKRLRHRQSKQAGGDLV